MPVAPRCMRSRCSTRSASARRCSRASSEGDFEEGRYRWPLPSRPGVDRQRRLLPRSRSQPAAPRMLRAGLAMQWGEAGRASACSCDRCGWRRPTGRLTSAMTARLPSAHARRRPPPARLHPDRSAAGHGAAGGRPGAGVRHAAARPRAPRQRGEAMAAAQRTHARGRGLPAHAASTATRPVRSPSTTASGHAATLHRRARRACVSSPTCPTTWAAVARTCMTWRSKTTATTRASRWR